MRDFRLRPGRIAAPALVLLLAAIALCLAPVRGAGLYALPPPVFLVAALVVAAVAWSPPSPRPVSSPSRRPTGRSPPSLHILCS